MTSRDRPIVVLAAVLLCLCTCTSAYASAAAAEDGTAVIPGPLRSFLRIAGVSQKTPAEDVMPSLAHNVAVEGYLEHGKPTEFWYVLNHYVQQARELQTMAGATETLRVANCADVGPLLKILGYKLRQGCNGKDITLVTDVPARAFLTLDSGFPLTDLEEALQNGVPFVYPFHPSAVPALFHEKDWTAFSPAKKGENRDLLNALLQDGDVSRLYLALSKMDTPTRLELERSPGLKALLPYAGVLDFYGSEICVRSGRVVVPGEANAERGWKELVGESPESPGSFVQHLVAKDNGWLAAYFDVLSRISRTQQERFTQMPRLKNLYEAFRSTAPQMSATASVFRKAPELLVLFTRMQWEANGDPHVPGDLDAWKEILGRKSEVKLNRDWGKRARGWNRSEQLLEAMTAFSKVDSESGPLATYLTMSEIDGGRSSQDRLSPTTVRLLGKRFAEFHSWYLIFSEFPNLNDASVSSFIATADAIDKIPGHALRINTLGAFQANIGLWQIFARQGQIPKAEQKASWQKMISPFAKIASSAQLFDATRSSLGETLLTATGKANCSQDEIIDLLAGPAQESADGQRAHAELAARIRAVLEDQRLASLDTLGGLGDGLKQMKEGTPAGDELLSLAGDLREFEMPDQSFINGKKAGWTPAVYSSRHAELEVRTELIKTIKAPASRMQLETARGQLAPFLRDTLVGLNYAYYEPPGAQMLHNNPLFVRAHDFSGTDIPLSEGHWSSPDLLGAGVQDGGGAYMTGSLSDLPYALANAEQDFIVSENIQALIWKEMVPKLLVDATLPRWWGISPNELHAVALYQRFGEELLTASAGDAELRGKVVNILSDRMAPKRLEWAEQPRVSAEDVAAILPGMLPADTFYLAAEFRRRFPTEAASWGPTGQQLEQLCVQYPAEVSPERLSADFGVPHPVFSQTYGRDLLKVKPLYYSGGYSGRLFGESWESSNLYWARLADEMGYSPVTLNRLVPELTRHMISKIFATDLDDWPALLRAMQETGKDFREGKLALAPGASVISQK